jgi:host factor-I protein
MNGAIDRAALCRLSSRIGGYAASLAVWRGLERDTRKPRMRAVMAAERVQSLQDTFLNYVRKNKTPLTIFLVNGVKLQGIVTWFDNFCVLLRRDGHSQLVYKHAISTIMPGQPVHLMDADQADGP